MRRRVLRNRTYCYAELAVSSLEVVVTISSTHYAYPSRDGQAELARVAWLNTKILQYRNHIESKTYSVIAAVHCSIRHQANADDWA